ncbi:Arginase [Paenibacillus konkukensis]|uniref:Arginase n=1 Tax=Paenibacillus konkukensis TaxID=2020716 RepID=A0ABY4RZX9_9BACL|nr:arginase [Paenibacillus konkukensis]UQZ87458.1 Arginase [Paenibacillus konkukensis]
MNDSQAVHVIGAPLDLGAGCRGCRMGPDAIRCAGLLTRLRQQGRMVQDLGDVTLTEREKLSADSAGGHPKAKYIDEIVRFNRRLHRKTAASVEAGAIPLILGGDHSIAAGTIAGAARHKRIGVLWFDAHGDLNTVQTSPSGNVHGMPLAAMLGYGYPALKHIGGKRPKVRPEHLVLIGTRSLDTGEQELIQRAGIRMYASRELHRLGMSEVVRQALAAAGEGTDGIHVSFDLDGLDPGEAPGVGTPVSAGMRLTEALEAMRVIAASGLLVSAEFVEVNPALDLRSKTAHAAVELICSLLGSDTMEEKSR